MDIETTIDFDTVVDSLVNMFGDILSRDVILTIVEGCGGDLNTAADAIMNITCDTNSLQENTTFNAETKEEKKEESTQNLDTVPNQESTISYAAASQRIGAMPKQQIEPTASYNHSIAWSEDFRRIVMYYNQGYRVLILMRGAPGSGKSYLAEKLIEATVGGTFAELKTHICSTDDYFMVRGRYNFNKHDLPYAHSVNQRRAISAMEQGLSPVIIDNTNIEVWETEPYVRAGVTNGYIIEVLEPNTPWAKKPNQLCRRNVHNVPITSIRRMLENYINNLTGDSLIRAFGLSYPADKVPPVIRSMPVFRPSPKKPISQENTNFATSSEKQQNKHLDTNMESLSITDVQTLEAIPIPNNDIQISTASNSSMTTTEKVLPTVKNSAQSAVEIDDDTENKIDLNSYVDVQKQLEEIEKVEREWENGENWIAEQDVSTDHTKHTESIEVTVPKPQRKKQSHTNSDEKILGTFDGCQDWRQISMFMPPWSAQEGILSQSINLEEIPVETVSNSTCIEIGDVENTSNMLKVITATPRDINQFNFSLNKEKIPEKRMLDKSSMTNENSIPDLTNRCQSEEKHFNELRKLFKNVSKHALRDIFDKCMGDVNWAVEIVLDGVASKQLETIDIESTSDIEEDASTNDDLCSCLAAYNILPDKSLTQRKSLTTQSYVTPVASGSSPKVQSQKKSKKESTSGDSLQLKRIIEQNVDFSENHYSQHCLKIRKFRRGEYELSDENPESDSVKNDETESAQSTTDLDCQASGYSHMDASDTSFDDVEKTVVVNLGWEFVAQLDKLFGRNSMNYPNKVLPKINVPLSLLNEINALWIESLMDEMDEHDKQTAIMVKEDEEFARQLSMKEAELTLAGKEPEVPDFKEIMDMDLALSLYQKDVAEWRNKEPNDLAAKLTRDKLYNLFPDVAKEILSELLMAHDNNFQITVEVLLMSTGKANILEQKNGLNKFVMQKEMERQERLLEEERKALSEVEWPLLPRGEVVEMSTVNSYRERAERHLINRNM
ncbi:unnamed protein product [Diatraea saccharalis]|uniref:CUE domain-containing protein n=1 Tax=Diatraea saccharalis TaxID=40085 RepID=A0A9N9R1T8_9NEOP|nr:unnamed protein product [Diatraea saccharalis]